MANSFALYTDGIFSEIRAGEDFPVSLRGGENAMESYAAAHCFTADPEPNRAVSRLVHRAGQLRIIGHSEAMTQVRQKIARLASYKVCVVICGETGTGKELLARSLHYLGPRSAKPFVAVNCGAIPQALFENEFFGHMSGAFTDARAAQKGIVDEARGGTLFLDEIGSIDLWSQVKLLRLLQDEEYKSLGDPKPRRADIRVVAATSKPLHCLVEEGTFREDLFYRLNVVCLTVPPLRERAEDIPVLAEHFISEYCTKLAIPIKKMTEEVMRALMSHSWPGNVRELENRVQQMVVMSESPFLSIDDFQPRERSQVNGRVLEPFNVAKKRAIDSFEDTYLRRLLTEYRGDVVRAAEKAGKSRTGLWNLLRKHGLVPNTFRPRD